MSGRLISHGCIAVLFASWCVATTGPLRTGASSGPSVLGVDAQGPDVGTEAQRASGKTVYLKYCAQCHGENGDGDGVATPHLFPRPRDFTLAQFKVRTTPS